MTKPKRSKAKRGQPMPADLGTPQTQTRAEIHEVKGVGRRAYVSEQTNLDRYRALNHISEIQWQAGQRMAALWYVAVGSQQIIGGYGDRVPGANGPSDLQVEARKKLTDLWNDLNRVERIVLVDCVAFDAPVRVFGDDGLAMLKSALNSAARHWGMN